MATHNDSRARARSRSETAARAAKQRRLERAAAREALGTRPPSAAYERQLAATAARAVTRERTIDRQTAERAARAAARAAALGGPVGPVGLNVGTRAFTMTTQRDLARRSTALHSTLPRNRANPFLKGLGSVADFFGLTRLGGMLDVYLHAHHRTRPVAGITDADLLALERDWRVVGGDFERAMKAYEAEAGELRQRAEVEPRNKKQQNRSDSQQGPGSARATA